MYHPCGHLYYPITDHGPIPSPGVHFPKGPTNAGKHDSRSKPTKDQKRRVKVLVVDDDASSVAPLQQILFNFDCDTTVVFDGFGAIEKLLEEEFDLMILDWIMPGMTGAETIKEMNNIMAFKSSQRDEKQRPRLNIPVVTYSSTPLSDLYLPMTNHFKYISHWEKPVRYSQLTHLTSKVLDHIQHED